MSILKEIKAYEYDRNKRKEFGIKSGIVWGHSNKVNAVFPLLYISKPKGISQQDFEILLDRLDITFKQN